ncbi:ribosome-recycling factor [Acrasis kona]|uniref:Ribosome-recycling factor n=1 Tax=Acrasis kona TaxID=1008807 RepID=A0AAW2YVD8_9EUKA
MPAATTTASNINNFNTNCSTHFNAKNNENTSTPFWFGNEEGEHLQTIINYYTNFLRLNENRPASSREPRQFIGKIKRRSLETNKGFFVTVDDIFVYQYAMRNWGQVMPLVKTINVMTEWNSLDGIPLFQTRCDESKAKQADTRVKPIYYLPLFGCGYFEDTQFACSRGKDEDSQVGYADEFNQLLQHTMPIEKCEAEHETILIEEFDEDDEDNYECSESDSDSDDEEKQEDENKTNYLSSDYLTAGVSQCINFGLDELSNFSQDSDSEEDYDSWDDEDEEEFDINSFT